LVEAKDVVGVVARLDAGQTFVVRAVVGARPAGEVGIGEVGKDPAIAARDSSIVRWYQDDQVINVVRSDPLGVNRVTEISLEVTGELEDVFDGSGRVVGVVIQRPYVRQVYVP
jgi:hypothetical protein